MKRRTLFSIAAACALPALAQPACSIYAQQLVDSTLAKHPEITVMALHVTPPQGKQNIIIASNIGRIGKLADADDMSVLETGKPRIERTRTGDLSVELRLLDAGGNTVGVMGSTFSAKVATDNAIALDLAEKVRDELRGKTTSLAGLFEPVR
ncbi:MAG: TonB-dependent siderophore receptor [Massilia sp.]|nr:TonB-dependent siderophore receptor [Massilia sp.]